MKRVLFFTPFFEDTDWKSFGLNPEKLGKVNNVHFNIFVVSIFLTQRAFLVIQNKIFLIKKLVFKMAALPRKEEHL